MLIQLLQLLQPVPVGATPFQGLQLFSRCQRAPILAKAVSDGDVFIRLLQSGVSGRQSWWRSFQTTMLWRECLFFLFCSLCRRLQTEGVCPRRAITLRSAGLCARNKSMDKSANKSNQSTHGSANGFGGWKCWFQPPPQPPYRPQAGLFGIFMLASSARPLRRSLSMARSARWSACVQKVEPSRPDPAQPDPARPDRPSRPPAFPN